MLDFLKGRDCGENKECITARMQLYGEKYILVTALQINFMETINFIISTTHNETTFAHFSMLLKFIDINTSKFQKHRYGLHHTIGMYNVG